ncbi:caspase family protein [Treponema sp. OttesenSCG-928-L16]|nr:caspase family protein [Treponema sp. OttesenSCG-928-L16]
MKRKGIVFGICCFIVSAALWGADEQSTKRFGIFIGANNGGRDRTMLRYAVSDARAVSRVFADMGGISGEDNILLTEPGIGEINSHIAALNRRVRDSKDAYKRTEIIFYYSGHSDEDGLLLNRETYSYRDLRERINEIPSDMRIVILDSCSSGAFTRLKGGVKTQPFLIDDSVSAEGYAFLTSSSATEASQESDIIEGSYFTHSLVAGLRGAADTIGDGRVTLNEAYRFAYTETLAKTETSLYGVQHPSYDMQVSGTGDVVLTDIKETSSSMIIDTEITGRISIRDSSDFLIAEITKVTVKPMELGLEPGLYKVTLQRGDNYYRTEVMLLKDRRTEVRFSDFALISAAVATARGGDASAENDETGDPKYLLVPVNFQLVPSVGYGNVPHEATNNFLIGVLVADGYNLNGVGAATIGLRNRGTVSGVQASGIYNIAVKDMSGVQGSGVFNMAGGDFLGVQGTGAFNIVQGNMQGAQGAGLFNISGASARGAQGSGLFNWTNGDMRGAQGAGLFNFVQGDMRGVQAGPVNIAGGEGGGGLQLGLVNISRNENVVPVGLVNIIKGGIFNPSVSIDDMSFMNLNLKSGSKHFYTLLSVGVQGIDTDGVSFSIAEDGQKDHFVWRAGVGFEIPIGPVFLDIDVLNGTIVETNLLGKSGWDDDDDDSLWRRTTMITQARVSAGFKVFKHLGAYVGISYDYLWRKGPFAADPSSRLFSSFDWSTDRHIHRLGAFAGIQF